MAKSQKYCTDSIGTIYVSNAGNERQFAVKTETIGDKTVGILVIPDYGGVKSEQDKAKAFIMGSDQFKAGLIKVLES